MSDPIELFRLAIAAAGLTRPDTINADGAIHRFSSNGKRGDDSGWYILHLDSIPAGVFGCWREGFSQPWCAKSGDDMTQVERGIHRQRIKAMQMQREAEHAQRQQQASESVATLWAQADPVEVHPYLTAKGIKPHGLKLLGDKLLIPMRDTVGTLHSLQTIEVDGEKRFHPGGRVKGCYHSIGKPDGRLIICEGYATGESIHQCTGLAVAVAFNAGNLGSVAVSLQAKYPTLAIIIAADDDHLTAGNPGLTKATAAAQAIGGFLAVPVFTADRAEKHTDFNDLHQTGGAGAVKACIDAARELMAAAPLLRDGVILISGSDLTPEAVRWLWHEWLALGKLHILAGAPGQGKTTIAIAFAATITSGGRWPDGSRCAPANVLIWSGEDDPADTLLPRLLAAGADRSRCHFVIGTRIDGEVQSFDPARDMADLEYEAQRVGGIKLLIVDPVVSAVAGDSHKNTEVRRALQPLVDLASRLDAAVLGISHFSKGGAGGDPASRVVGSIAFTAVARVVLVAAKVNSEEGEDRRILARGKSNIGPDDGGFEYHIEQSEPLPGIHASYIAWGNGVAGTARELLTEPDGHDGNGEDKSAVDAAADFVRQVLADGLTPAKTVKEESASAGVSWASVRRAADGLRVLKSKGAGGAWYWKLPSTLGQGAQGAQRLKVEHLEQVEHLEPENTAGADAETEDAEVF